MNTQKYVAAKAKRNIGIMAGQFLAVAAVAMLWLAPGTTHAAGGGSMTASGAIKFEAVEGSDEERLILTEKAAERIGVEIGQVGEAPIVRRQMVGGMITLPVEILPDDKAPGTFSGFDKVALAVPKRAETSGIVTLDGNAWVRVTLSPGEWERLAKDKPARIMPLATNDIVAAGADFMAVPAGYPPIEDVKRSMLTLYYKLPNVDHGMALDSRVRVELQLANGNGVRKVVPYSAVIYDAHGNAWTYVELEPLVYQRRSIDVERIVGDLAVLSSDLELGTPIVTVAAQLLYGSEFYFRN